MKLDSTTLRRLIPAGAVVGVLALSYLAQTPSLASNNDVGYGYRDNCGVKGDGFHDHGKACPNRPFPGHGNGVEEILGNTSSASTDTELASGKRKGTSNSQANGTSSVTGNSTNPGKSHGHGHGKGHANGRGSA